MNKPWTAYVLPRIPGPLPKGVKGSLRRRREAHMQFASPFVMKVITNGARMLFGGTERPPKRVRFLRPRPVPLAQTSVIDSWLEDALKKGYVERGPVTMIHPIFAVPKASGGWRVVIDLRRLNKFLLAPHFKLPSVEEAATIATKGSFATKVDLTDAFHHLEYQEEAKRWSGFSWRGRTYRYAVLAFGNRSSPWWLSRVLNPAIRALRMQGVQMICYVDDMLIIAPSEEQARKDTLRVVAFLTDLGWNINFAKSELTPRNSIEFLGYTLDFTGHPAIGIPLKKKKAISHELSRAARASTIRAKCLARVIGVAISISKALIQTQMLLRGATRDLQQGITRAGWRGLIDISPSTRSDLATLANLIRTSRPRPINPPVEIEVRTDASLTGLGAVLLNPSESVTTPVIDSMSMPNTEPAHINVLELKAVLLAIVKWAPHLQHKVVRLKMDNLVALSYVRRGTGRTRELQKLARRISFITLQNDITLQPQYIPSGVNSMADLESRRWSLPPLTAAALAIRGPVLSPYPNAIPIAREMAIAKAMGGAVLTPMWKSAAWWPLLQRESKQMIAIPNHLVNLPHTPANAPVAKSGKLALWSFSSKRCLNCRLNIDD